MDLAEKAKKQGISPELVRDLTTARENLVIAVRLGGKLDADPQQWTGEATALLDPTALGLTWFTTRSAPSW